MRRTFNRINTPATPHARKRTLKVLAFTVAGLIFAIPSLSLAAGALAIDENQGDQYGWAINYQTYAEAEQRAQRECGNGCRIVMRFSNTCAAYAADQAGRSTAYGWAYGYSNSSGAQNGALAECQRHGGSYCIVRVWGCDAP